MYITLILTLKTRKYVKSELLYIIPNLQLLFQAANITFRIDSYLSQRRYTQCNYYMLCCVNDLRLSILNQTDTLTNRTETNSFTLCAVGHCCKYQYIENDINRITWTYCRWQRVWRITSVIQVLIKSWSPEKLFVALLFSSYRFIRQKNWKSICTNNFILLNFPFLIKSYFCQ